MDRKQVNNYNPWTLNRSTQPGSSLYSISWAQAAIDADDVNSQRGNECEKKCQPEEVAEMQREDSESMKLYDDSDLEEGELREGEEDFFSVKPPTQTGEQRVPEGEKHAEINILGSRGKTNMKHTNSTQLSYESGSYTKNIKSDSLSTCKQGIQTNQTYPNHFPKSESLTDGRKKNKKPQLNLPPFKKLSRLLSDTSLHLNKVTVKEAQRSLKLACENLKIALCTMLEIYEATKGNWSTFKAELEDKWNQAVSQSFNGFNALFTVVNTALGREQETTQGSPFLQLLNFTFDRKEKLFSQYQASQIEKMQKSIQDKKTHPTTRSVPPLSTPQSNVQPTSEPKARITKPKSTKPESPPQHIPKRQVSPSSFHPPTKQHQSQPRGPAPFPPQMSPPPPLHPHPSFPATLLPPPSSLFPPTLPAPPPSLLPTSDLPLVISVPVFPPQLPNSSAPPSIPPPGPTPGSPSTPPDSSVSSFPCPPPPPSDLASLLAKCDPRQARDAAAIVMAAMAAVSQKAKGNLNPMPNPLPSTSITPLPEPSPEPPNAVVEGLKMKDLQEEANVAEFMADSVITPFQSRDPSSDGPFPSAELEFEEEERIQRLTQEREIVAKRKLSLVLDLDHTLLNSAKFSEVDPFWEERLKALLADNAVRPREHQELFRFPRMAMWTKLRPGVREFLRKVSSLFLLHISTMGNSSYAQEMKALLDPEGELFQGRVIAKGDELGHPELPGFMSEAASKVKDLKGVLGLASSVLVVDDSAKVWPQHSANLVVVERYMYFPSSRAQFGIPGPSLLEAGRDERPHDGMLASVSQVLERVHKEFFTRISESKERPHSLKPDVRVLLVEVQRKVLEGCHVLFSRVFPTDEIHPQLHPLWRIAEQFGATCTLVADSSVTHVVSTAVGTDKTRWGFQNGKYVVRPSWLEASAILYRRADENEFSLASL